MSCFVGFELEAIKQIQTRTTRMARAVKEGKEDGEEQGLGQGQGQGQGKGQEAEEGQVLAESSGAVLGMNSNWFTRWTGYDFFLM